jgi:hypothetical protein
MQRTVKSLRCIMQSPLHGAARSKFNDFCRNLPAEFCNKYSYIWYKKNYKFIYNSLQIFSGAKREMLGNISLLHHTAWSNLITAWCSGKSIWQRGVNLIAGSQVKELLGDSLCPSRNNHGRSDISYDNNVVKFLQTYNLFYLKFKQLHEFETKLEKTSMNKEPGIVSLSLQENW